MNENVGSRAGDAAALEEENRRLREELEAMRRLLSGFVVLGSRHRQDSSSLMDALRLDAMHILSIAEIVEA